MIKHESCRKLVELLSFHQQIFTFRQKASRNENRTTRCSIPSRPVLIIPKACINDPLVTFPVGLEWCGVLARLNISARKLSANFSLRANLRSTPKSALTKPGPRRLFVPQVPKRPVGGAAKADLLYHP